MITLSGESVAVAVVEVAFDVESGDDGPNTRAYCALVSMDPTNVAAERENLDDDDEEEEENMLSKEDEDEDEVDMKMARKATRMAAAVEA